MKWTDSNLEIRSDRPDNQPALLVWDRVNDRYNWYVQPNGYMYARNCEISGTISSSTITGSTISTGWRFSVNSDGVLEAYTSGGGYLKMGSYTDHPAVSGLNVGASGISLGDHKLNLTAGGSWSYLWSNNGLDNIHFLNSSGNEIPDGAGGSYTSFLDVINVVRYCKSQGWVLPV